MLVKPAPLKENIPILVTESGIAILVKSEQSRKALAPILVTDSGIVMLVKAVSLKASLPILVTTFPDTELYISTETISVFSILL